MSALLVRYTDFTKGDAGYLDKSKIDAGSFIGENVHIFRDGSVGPRSGLLDLTPTNWPSGSVYDLGYVDPGNQGDEFVWIRKGTRLARVLVYHPIGGGAIQVQQSQAWANTTSGAFAVAQPQGDYVDVDPRYTLFTILTDKCYKCDWQTGANGTLTAIAGSPGGNAMEVFGGFAVVGGISGRANRIIFSKAGDFTTWPAGNFLDLGEIGLAGAGGAPNITALCRVKDQLLAFCSTGQIFVITGTLGENEVVRELTPSNQMSGPAWPGSVVRARDGSVWWTRREETPNLHDQDYDAPSAVPISYSGGIISEQPLRGGYLRQRTFESNRTSETTGVSGRGDKSAVFFDCDHRAIVMRDGVWTRHNFDGTGDFHPFRVTAGSRGDVFMADVAGETLCAWQYELERPPFNFGDNQGLSLPFDRALPWDDHELGGQLAPGWFATPEYRPQNFGLLTVDRVEILLTSHRTGSNLDNQVFAYLQQYDATGTIAEVVDTTQSNIGVRPPDSDVGVGGTMNQFGVTVGLGSFQVSSAPSVDTRQRAILVPDDDARPSPGIRIYLEGMRGVSVHEILVFGTLDSPGEI